MSYVLCCCTNKPNSSFLFLFCFPSLLSQHENCQVRQKVREKYEICVLSVCVCVRNSAILPPVRWNNIWCGINTYNTNTGHFARNSRQAAPTSTATKTTTTIQQYHCEPISNNLYKSHTLFTPLDYCEWKRGTPQGLKKWDIKIIRCGSAHNRIDIVANRTRPKYKRKKTLRDIYIWKKKKSERNEQHTIRGSCARLHVCACVIGFNV